MALPESVANYVHMLHGGCKPLPFNNRAVFSLLGKSLLCPHHHRALAVPLWQGAVVYVKRGEEQLVLVIRQRALRGAAAGSQRHPTVCQWPQGAPPWGSPAAAHAPALASSLT